MPIIPDNLIGIFKKTADNLKGSAKRVFMGEVVSTYGYGAQLEAEAVLALLCHTSINSTKFAKI